MSYVSELFMLYICVFVCGHARHSGKRERSGLHREKKKKKKKDINRYTMFPAVINRCSYLTTPLLHPTITLPALSAAYTLCI